MARAAAMHEATYTFRFESAADADAVHGSLDVERDDRIPNVTATVRRDADRTVLHVVLSSDDLGDLRAATKSFFTRIQAAAAALEAADRKKDAGEKTR